MRFAILENLTLNITPTQFDKENHFYKQGDFIEFTCTIKDEEIVPH